MSRLTDLIAAARSKDTQLGEDLDREVRAFLDRRAFGLNFERHQPETVELPLRTVRRGEKVRVRDAASDRRLWVVLAVVDDETGRCAELQPLRSGDAATLRVPVDNLIVVAEFRDVIYPGLRSEGVVRRGGPKPWNSVITAENYHALKALTYTHRGRIDAIYIDPPYNTGSRDWKYNNDYVETEDQYRHSKWLAFMERRLSIAKELLNPDDSVLICAIDENEVNRLGLLLEQVFHGVKIQMVTVLSNPAGASIIDQFSRVDEHLFFVHIGKARPQRTRTDTTPGFSTFVDAAGNAKPFTWEPLQRSGGNSRRQDTKAKFFPIWIDEERGIIAGCGDYLPDGLDRSEAPSPPPGCVAQWPIKRDGSEACWQLSAPTFRLYFEQGRIKLGRRQAATGRWGFSFLTKGHMAAIANGELVTDGRDATGALVVRNAEGVLRSQTGKTLWTNGAYSATEHGSTLLSKFLPGRKFPFPKSLYAVEDALRYYIGHKPNAVVLDFFAGSGTTAHAVMRLNHEDGGTRQWIMVTNNEVSADEQRDLRAQGLKPGDAAWQDQGICRQITQPRVTAAITGRTLQGNPIAGDYRFTDPFAMSDGFEENVEFFELTYETPLSVSHNLAFAEIAPLLWLKAGALGDRIDQLPEAGWAVTQHYGLLVDLDKASAFSAAVENSPLVDLVYVVTDDDRRFQAVARRLPQRTQPVRLWESYLANFRFVNGD